MGASWVVSAAGKGTAAWASDLGAQVRQGRVRGVMGGQGGTRRQCTSARRCGRGVGLPCVLVELGVPRVVWGRHCCLPRPPTAASFAPAGREPRE